VFNFIVFLFLLRFVTVITAVNCGWYLSRNWSLCHSLIRC